MDVTRARKVKIGLAGLAVLGFGAALTSAVWTDQVFFRADVQSGTFNIQGATEDDPTNWQESDVGVPAGDIALDLGTVGITPSEEVYLYGFIRTDPTSTWTGDISDITVDESQLPAGVTATVNYTTTTGNSSANLAPGEEMEFEVTVTSDATLAQGAVGSLVVQVDGESFDPAFP